MLEIILALILLVLGWVKLDTSRIERKVDTHIEEHAKGEFKGGFKGPDTLLRPGGN